MANKIYPRYKDRVYAELLTSVVSVVLVDLGVYTYSDQHRFLSDIPQAARISTFLGLTNRSLDLGVFDADDVLFAAVFGNSAEALVLYTDTGDETTSRLVAFIDSAISGLPLTPVGGNVRVQWNSGPERLILL